MYDFTREDPWLLSMYSAMMRNFIIYGQMLS